MTTKLYLETLGCAKNRVDSEIMLGILNANSFSLVGGPQDAEVIILNTCAFLTSAVEESIGRIVALAEYKSKGRCRSLIVVGCLSERYREELLAEMPEIDGIMGTSDYTNILPCVRAALEEQTRRSYLSTGLPRYSLSNSTAERVLSTARHYAYLKISEGCSNMCSFCNIPKLRGAFSSRPMPHIKHEFNMLLDVGVKEVNIISQDSSSYGMDLPKESNLLNLVRLLLDGEQRDFWLRVFYSYPNRYPVGLFEMMSQDRRLARYIDMPFQHISDPVLKAMNRRITRAKIEELLEEAFALVPDLAVRTTFITGFPTEAEEDFQELLAFVSQGWFSHVGVFCYSHEDNIRSAKYGDTVPDEVKKERRGLLMEAQQKVSLAKNQGMVGKRLKVLVRGSSEETPLLMEARTEYQGVDVDGVVYINDGIVTPGDFTEVLATEAHPYDLVASVAPGLEEHAGVAVETRSCLR